MIKKYIPILFISVLIHISAFAQTNTATITQAGWYRIAINGPLGQDSTHGNRAAARFILVDKTSAMHQTVELLGYVHYGSKPSIVVLNNSYHHASIPTFEKIRLVEGGTYGGAAIEVYVHRLSLDCKVAYYIENNVQFEGWTPVNWQLVTASADDNDSIPAGFFARVINLTNLVQGYVTDAGQQKSFFNGNFYTSGNMGIGMEMPQSKLAVNGAITAKQVKVTQSGWPDYVFDPGYALPPLDSVDAYIRERRHLPDLPSAAEISQKGNDLGQTDALLLKKIEELALYVIQQNKQIEELTSHLTEQQKEIETLKEDLGYDINGRSK